MTRTRRTLINRRAAAILAATLTVGATGSAAARPFDLNSTGSFVPAQTTTAPSLDLNMGGFPGPGPAPAGQPTGDASTHSTGVASAEYVVIGAGGATVALIGIGAVSMATRRRHRPTAPAQQTIAA
jgi:hypothetical protein